MPRRPPTPLLLLAGILPLFILPVWLGAGTVRIWQTPFIPLALWAWACFFLAPASRNFPSRTRRLRLFARDPALWASIGFLIFIGIQAWNSGRMLVPDFETNSWTYSPPPHPSLPTTLNPEEAMEMLRWFAPILTGFLLAKHAMPLLRDHSPFLPLIALNAVLNACLAFAHHFLAWDKMYYNVRDTGRDTYGSFGYPNHAATYFILMFGFSAALLLRTLLRDRSERRPCAIAAASLAVVLTFLAAQFSASRAGMLGSAIVCILILLTVALIAWPRLHPVHRLYGGMALLLFILILLGGFHLFAQPVHLREWSRATTNLDAGREFSARFFQIQSAWNIWKDHPWFGVGGWGYRYYVSFYLDPSHWGFLGKGKANVHHDFFQFLAEFGLVGITLLATVFLPSTLRLLRQLFHPPTDPRSLWADPLRFCSAFALLLMLAHSFIDLPFRSPAVFLHGVLLLALAQAPLSNGGVWSEKVHWQDLQPPPLRMKNRS